MFCGRYNHANYILKYLITLSNKLNYTTFGNWYYQKVDGRVYCTVCIQQISTHIIIVSVSLFVTILRENT